MLSWKGGKAFVKVLWQFARMNISEALLNIAPRKNEGKGSSFRTGGWIKHNGFLRMWAWPHMYYVVTDIRRQGLHNDLKTPWTQWMMAEATMLVVFNRIYLVKTRLSPFRENLNWSRECLTCSRQRLTDHLHKRVLTVWRELLEW